MLEVRLFGKFDVRLDGISVLLQGRIDQSLLAFLVLNAGTAYRREKLAGIFWPESDDAKAKSNLRHALWRIRKSLKDISPNYPDALQADKITIALNPQLEYWLDVAILEKEESKSTQELLESTAVYTGELLPGFYEEWSLLERERLRTVFERKMNSLVESLLSEHRWQEAIQQAERWMAFGETPETAYRALMIAYAGIGEVPAAIAAYHRCAEALKNDLGVEPSAETKVLVKKLRLGELADILPARHAIRGYQLQELIGTGSFGAVYRALQPAVGREVAVKVILPQHANDPEFIRRFEVKAQTVARLEHPHIVPLYDYWREPDGAFLVMRLLRGGSLVNRLQAGPIELAEAVEVIDQIASALHAAHQQGVVHRDVKPANILFDEAGNAYLSDFGIANLPDENVRYTASGQLFGTPVYMSPEQLLNQPVTPRSDLYSFGILLY